jgi:4-hydroxy-3-methylbut-2-en-1-yl diphosphate reductase
MTKPPLTLYLAAPRGFCAGVDRAIKIVEMAIEKWGAPVYVRHEIVHNKFVVDGLRARGAVFVEELDDVPPDRPVIFSAHGVPKAVPAEAARREMVFVDATCPLVSKVHIEAERHHEAGLQMVMIGHAAIPKPSARWANCLQARCCWWKPWRGCGGSAGARSGRLAFITQTTLSVDDTADIVAALQARFPAIVGPHKEDICYATTNRQAAVKAIAPRIDALLVIGAPNSSNSKRLVEVGRAAGCPYAQLVQRATDIDWRALEGIRSVGITAGASAPEVLVNEVLDAFRARFDTVVELVETAQENVEFKVPRICANLHERLGLVRGGGGAAGLGAGHLHHPAPAARCRRCADRRRGKTGRGRDCRTPRQPCPVARAGGRRGVPVGGPKPAGPAGHRAGRGGRGAPAPCPAGCGGHARRCRPCPAPVGLDRSLGGDDPRQAARAAVQDRYGKNPCHTRQANRRPDRKPDRMTPIPPAALLLALAGLLPFLWGVATLVWPGLAELGQVWLGPRFIGPYVLLAYGTVILSFMSGVLWGFATRATGRVAAIGYALSVSPALWAFFMVGNGPVAAASSLIAGFGGLLVLDWVFWRMGLAPNWWMTLRVPLTAGVVACLSVPVLV